jgi:predicted enzyme related to lactoylglutathione lyase
MPLSVRSVTIDCADPYRLAGWWCRVFGVPMSEHDFPDDPEALCTLGAGRTRLLFERVPEAKAAKNRVHVDIQAGRDRDLEVDRLVAMGATLVADHRDHDPGWVVLADPEGNEFCVERGAPDAD